MRIIKSETLPNGLRYTAGMPEGTCSQMMEVLTQGDTIVKVQISGGCGGNTQGVSRLAEGGTIQEVVARLRGIDCGGKGTSCPDQLAQLLVSVEDN